MEGTIIKQKGNYITMMCLRKDELHSIAHLFEGWEDTMIYSCLEGHMGEAYVIDTCNPLSAQLVVGDFCFFAGAVNKELAEHIPADFKSEYLLIIPQNEAWSKQIESSYGAEADKIVRYAIKKETGIFNKDLLKELITELPEEYTLVKIEENLYYESAKYSWSRDLCSQFATYDEYKKHGVGTAVVYQGHLAAGASSYTFYNGGIEIEIDTQPEHRRKGLAKACAASLILECLERNLYPSWDAHDMRSVHLAEKLGYHMDKAYDTYCVKVKKLYEN